MTLQDYLNHGASEGERNHSLYCAILAAREAGWSDYEIKDGIFDRAKRDGLSSGEIDTTYKSAMAKPVELKRKKTSEGLAWNGFIGAVETAPIKTQSEATPETQLTDYLNTLFEPHEIITYTTTYKADQSGIHPAGKGVYTRRVCDVIADVQANGVKSLKTDKDAGAWIRLNPFDGEGVADANVTEYRHCLVESDKIPTDQQIEIVNKLKIPCAAIVYSGKKSMHAIVRIDAGTDKKLYDSRVKLLYETMDKAGLKIDRQNKNPSRLSRMPGVTRGDAIQTLVAVNTGAQSWTQWESMQSETPQGLPNACQTPFG
jgi:hypothetical protein